MAEKALWLAGKKRGRVEMRQGDEIASVVVVNGAVLAITRQGDIREIVASPALPIAEHGRMSGPTPAEKLFDGDKAA